MPNHLRQLYKKNYYDNNIFIFPNILKNKNINDIKSIHTQPLYPKKNKKGNNKEDGKK